jgi:SSS family transporter
MIKNILFLSWVFLTLQLGILDAKDAKLLFQTSQNQYPNISEHSKIIENDDILYVFNNGELFTRKDDQWTKDVIEQASSSILSHEGSLYIIGGLINNEPTNKITLLGSKNNEPIPFLPEPRTETQAVMLGNHLYVMGGRNGLENQADNKVWMLDLSNTNEGWIEKPKIPGPVLNHFAAISLFGEIHIFGGIASDKATSSSWGYREKPIDGTTRYGWRKIKEIPEAIATPVTLATGQTHITLIDADTGNSFIFHNLTDTWIESGKIPDFSSPLVGAIKTKGGFDLLSPDKIYRVEVKNSTRKLSYLDYIVIAIFLIIMSLIGLYFAKKQDNSEEFALGGRNVKWWAAAISMFATGASSISFMAIPAQTFSSSLIWLAPAVLLFPFIYWIKGYYLFPLIRKLNLTSVYSYLEMRFSPSLRYIASAQCVAFQLLGRMSVVMLLPAMAISAVTGLDVMLSVAIMGFLTTIYTTLGGFEAVIWTDVIQGFLMVLGALLMGCIAIYDLPNGFSDFIAINQEFDRFDLFITGFDMSLPLFYIFLLTIIFQQLGFAQDQPTIQRVLATPLKDVRKFTAMFCFFAVLIALVVNFAGLAIFANFQTYPETMSPTMNNDQVIPLFIIQNLPSGIAGLIIAALFAASMSTLSSSMNSVATITCEDFYKKFKKDATDQQALRFMKLASIIVGFIGTCTALYMAKMEIISMFKTWNLVCALIGGGFIGIYILGMFTKRANTIGVITGALTSIVVTIAVQRWSGFHWISYQPIAIFSCFIVGYITSLLTPAHTKNLDGLTVFTKKSSEN